MIRYLFLLFFTLFLYANNLKIASYNVENLFDLEANGSEYKEFIPNSDSNWNENIFNIKFANVLKVIEDLDADVIALQEIENENIIKLLKEKLPQYKYYTFSKYDTSSVGLGFLSKIKILESKNLDFKLKNERYRPILETTFLYDGVEFKIFNNHWPSKKSPESYRIKYAKDLQDRVSILPKDYDYILLGDFNSDYDEFQTFKNNIHLNNSENITGINHVLNTILNDNYITTNDILKESKKVHYNLWLELPSNERFSTKFRSQNSTLDNMILPYSLFDNKKLSYVPKSFTVFKPNYLYKNGEIFRWKVKDSKKEKIHQGEGFSDHLPIFGLFSLGLESKNIFINKKDITFIKDLYEIEKLEKSIILNDIVVIYKDKDSAIIKKKDDKAIFIYKNAQDLKVGFSYNIQINQIYDYFGTKEIKEFLVNQENKKYENYENLYLDGSLVDIFDFKYTNEIITNLTGIIKKQKLYINKNKYIKLYSKNKNILPKDGQNITILSGHLSPYKGNMQIIIYKSTDYKVNN